LAAIDNAVSLCRAGTPGAILITGAAATGKTELAGAFAARAAEDGLLVLHAIGLAAEQDLPLGVVAQLVRGLRKSERGAATAQLMSLVNEGRATNEPHNQADILRDLAEAFVGLASSGPVALVIDDVQFADAQSVQCLQHLAQQLHSVSLVLLIVECEQARPKVSPLSAVLLRHPRFCWLRLEPLSRDGVGEMIAEELDQPAAQRYLSGWFRVSGGNPLLVRALLQDHAPDRRAAASGQYAVYGGQTFAAAVLSCVDRSDPVTRDVVHALAVLGEDGSIPVLAQMTGLDQGIVNDVVRTLNAAGLARDGKFRHEAVRAPVLEGMSASDLSDLHSRAAEVLHNIGVAASTVAEHLVASDGEPPAWAFAVLREAAERAMDEGRTSHALECLELTIRFCHDGRERAVTTAILAQVQRQVEPAAAVRHLGTLGHAIRSGYLNERDTMTTILELALHGRRNEAVASLPRLSGTAYEITRIALSNFWPATDDADAGLRADPRSSSDAPIDPKMLAGLSLRTIFTGGSLDSAAHMAERALLGGRTGDTNFQSILSALTTLMYADRLNEGSAWCELLIGRLSADRSPGFHTPLSVIRAAIALRLGDVAGAGLHLDRAADCLSGDAWGVQAGFLRGTAILVNTEMGRLADATKIVSMALPRGTFATRYGQHYLYARGCYHLAMGQLQAALADFLQCGELAALLRMDSPSVVLWRTAAAETLLRLGRVDQAAELVHQQIAMPVPQSLRTRGICGRVKAAIADPSQQPDLLFAAIADLQSCGDRLELARAYADLSQAYLRLNQSGRARSFVRRARQLATQCGAGTLSRRLMPNGDNNSPDYFKSMRDPVARSLSAAEQRVAGLAAAGYTNREIAKRLFVTASTVEQHLTKIYRKLNVTRREDLPGELNADTA
jgi:DNA-binding CsgD family transcriptional regulator